MLRGIKKDVDEAIKWLETRVAYLPFETADGKKGAQPIQIALRYSVFGTWELVFPEEMKDIILTTLGFHINTYPNTAKMKYMLKLIRLAMGVKEYKPQDVSKVLPLPNDLFNNIHIIPIGIKEDDVFTEENGTKHEAL